MQYQFQQSALDMRDWLLLDSCSSVNLFCNSKFLTDIHDSPSALELTTNAGVIRTTQKATLPGYGEVWYNPNAMTNVFSLGIVSKKKKYHVTFDSQAGDTFRVKTLNATLLFKHLYSNIYASVPNDGKINLEQVKAQLFESVADNEKHYSLCQLERAKEA